MSQTTDFINNKIILLQSKVKEYNNDLDDYNSKILAVQGNIATWQSQIDAFNVELQKVQISDEQLSTAIASVAQSGVLNAQPAPTV